MILLLYEAYQTILEYRGSFDGSEAADPDRSGPRVEVYVGNLSFYTSEEQIAEFFRKCGEVQKVRHHPEHAIISAIPPLSCINGSLPQSGKSGWQVSGQQGNGRPLFTEVFTERTVFKVYAGCVSTTLRVFSRYSAQPLPSCPLFCPLTCQPECLRC